MNNLISHLVAGILSVGLPLSFFWVFFVSPLRGDHQVTNQDGEK